MPGKRKRDLSEAVEPKQSRFWAFTFYYEEEEALSLIERLKLVPLPWVAIKFQREVCPTTGRKHLQGCCKMEKKVVRSTIQKLINPARPAQVSTKPCYSDFMNSWNYCSKIETQDEDFEHVAHMAGDPGEAEPLLDSNGKASVILKLAEAGDWETLRTEHPAAYLYNQSVLRAARAAALVSPDVLDGVLDNYWIYGKAGQGKDMYARSLAPHAYSKAGSTKWWNGYDGESDVILRDVGLSTLHIVDLFKDWTDRYKFPAETKGGQIPIRPARTIVTSNFSPQKLFGTDPEVLGPILRRFRVIHMVDNTPYYLPRENVEKPVIKEPVYLEEDNVDML